MSDRSIRVCRLLLDQDFHKPTSNRDGFSCLEISVWHSKGGVSFLTGNRYPAGYTVNMHEITISDGCVSFVIGQGVNVSAMLDLGPRFNRKKLESFAAGLKKNPIAQELLTKLIQQGRVKLDPAEANFLQIEGKQVAAV